MSGVHPYRTIEQIAARMNDLDTRESINEALDELEHLLEVIPPEQQDPAEILIAQLQIRLGNLE